MAGRILVIDDDEDILEVVGLVLRSEGYQVETARDGVDALQKLRASSATSLILVDMMMPRMDGEGLVSALRDDPRLAEIPVVVMSGHDAAREASARLAAAACMVKPIELDELLGLVRRFAAPEGGSDLARYGPE